MTAAFPARTAEPSLLPPLSILLETFAQSARRRGVLAFFVCRLASAAVQGILCIPDSSDRAYEDENRCGLRPYCSQQYEHDEGEEAYLAPEYFPVLITSY